MDETIDKDSKLSIPGSQYLFSLWLQASDKDPRTKLEGDVRQLKSIPFDYREQHPELFTKEAMRSMIDKAISNGQASNSNANVPVQPESPNGE